MSLTRLKEVATLALTVSAVVAIGLFAMTGKGPDPDPDQPPRNPPAIAGKSAPAPAPAIKDEPGATVEVRGRVVDPKGRPVAGATLRLDHFMFLDQPPAGGEPRSSSGPDGRFALQAPRDVMEQFAQKQSRRPIRVVASAPGFGPGWVETGPRPDALAELTVRLVADDVPIEGRVLDLEGRPVAGAVIKTSNFFDPPGGDLSPWIEGMKANPTGPHEGLEEMPLDLTRTTGPDGRFRLDGVGRERVVMFTIAGPTIAITRTFAMTKDVPPLRSSNTHIIGPKPMVFHGARFDFGAAPSKPVLGVIRDQDTGTPLPGVRINGMPYDEHSRAFYHEVASTTDEQGRYRLPFLAQSDRYQLFATPGEGQPYPTAKFIEPAGSPGLEPATIDLRLKRGVLIRGRVTDKATGKPLRGSVEYHAFRDNPHAKEYPGFRESYAPSDYPDADGRFAVAALPGRGLLAARADSERYLWGIGAETIPGMNPRMPFSALPGFVSPRNYNVLAAVDADPAAGPLTCDLECDPGRTLPGIILGPDIKPIAGAWGWGLNALPTGEKRPQESAAFEATGLDPRRPRRLYFFHDGRALAGSLLAWGNEAGPLVVTLQPHGVITGRLLDEHGQPRAWHELLDFMGPDFQPDEGTIVKKCLTGPDGRFRLVVVPGLRYEADVMTEQHRHVGKAFKGVTVGPGEVKDLGDVTLKTPPRN